MINLRKIDPIYLAITLSFLLIRCGDGGHVLLDKAAGSQDENKVTAPASINASDGMFINMISISWYQSEGAEKYYIYRSDIESGTYNAVGEIDSPVSQNRVDPAVTYEDDISTGLEPGAIYYYSVRAWNSNGYSDFSGFDSGFLKVDPPAAPESVAASDGVYEDRVRITWNSVQYAQKYIILKSGTETGEYTEIGEQPGASTSFDDINPGLENGETAWYTVKAWNSAGYGDPGNTDSGMLKLMPPATPMNLVVTDGTYIDRITLTWTGVPVAFMYYIYRSDTEEGEYTEIGSAGGSGVPPTTYDDISGPLNGESYWYKIRAWNTAGYSDYSNKCIGSLMLQVPSVPVNIKATDGLYTDRIVVTWGTVPGTILYIIYRSTSPDAGYSVINNVTHPTAVYNDTDTNLVIGTIYYYKVKAYNSKGYSAYSASDSGFLKGAGVPDPPASASASEGAYPNKIEITWNAVTGATKYYVYRAASENGTYTEIGLKDDGSTHYNDTDPAILTGAVYWYKVKSWNSSGYSDFSNAVSGYTGI